jgi:hypothetical protein
MINTSGAWAFAPGSQGREKMVNTMNGSKCLIAATISIWLAVAGGAQARVLIVEASYNPGAQVVEQFRGCPVAEAGSEKLLPLLKRQATATAMTAGATPAAATPSIRVAMVSPVRTLRLSLPLMLGVGY